jgi:hypothetical protein
MPIILHIILRWNVQNSASDWVHLYNDLLATDGPSPPPFERWILEKDDGGGDDE